MKTLFLGLIYDSKSGKKVLGGVSAQVLLEQITQRVIQLQKQSVEILNAIEAALQEENIYFINEEQVPKQQHEFLREYFLEHVSPALVTVMLSKKRA